MSSNISKRVIFAAAIWFLTAISTQAKVAELPISSDACAIHLALTGAVTETCKAIPKPSYGKTRSLPASDFSQDAAPLSSSPEEQGYFIRFPFNSNELTLEYRDHLLRLSTVLGTPELIGSCIKLVGHADTIGNDMYNTKLSHDRAKMVAAFLAGEGRIDMPRLLTEARGETTPLHELPGAHPLNRRVEILARQKTGETCD